MKIKNEDKKMGLKRKLSLAALIAAGVLPAMNAHAQVIVETMIIYNINAPDLNGAANAQLVLVATDPSTGRQLTKNVASCQAPSGDIKYQCDLTGGVAPASTSGTTTTTR